MVSSPRCSTAMINFSRLFIQTILIILTVHILHANDSEHRYLLYDVFPGEGFNLRRDVYIRVANLVRLLRNPSLAATWSTGAAWKPLNWTLVLPPWSAIPHWNVWKDGHLFTNGEGLSWSRFFDLHSMHHLIPVMDLHEFQRHVLGLPMPPSGGDKLTVGHIDLALKLVRQFPSPGEVSETTQQRSVNFCNEAVRKLYRSTNSSASGAIPLRLYRSFFELHHTSLMPVIPMQTDCISGDLEARWLAPFLANLADEDRGVGGFSTDRPNNIRTVYLDSAETIIHGYWSEWSQEYWTARRSMVFAHHLRELGDTFRRQFLNSTDQLDRTLPPASGRPDLPSWLQAKWPLSPALGGPYLAVHWRRGDYVLDVDERREGVVERTPSPELAAKQIVAFVQRGANSSLVNEVTTVFLATDAHDIEVGALIEHLKPLDVVRFHEYSTPELEHQPLGPGELAIIDQWICAHARTFIGTSPSTFTFRIAEERTIMGFPPASTLNTLCPTGNSAKLHGDPESDNCEAITPWPIVVEPAFTSSGDPHEQHQEL